MKLLIICLLFGFFALLTVTAEDRPTNRWLIRHDDNKEAIVEAGDVDEALSVFRAQYKHEIIYSVARMSYVQTIWIR